MSIWRRIQVRESPSLIIAPALSQGKEILNDRGISRQKLVLGTHTSENEQNYLMIAEVTLPLEDSELDTREYNEEKKEVRSKQIAPSSDLPDSSAVGGWVWSRSGQGQHHPADEP